MKLNLKTMSEFNSEEAQEAQKNYVESNGFPHFAPYSGICYNCKMDIYSKISVESASNALITGCPHCNHSYCE